tara:strand:+ start:960 stop:1301 length:342 start_codon:yes stop_codon:yes gene_type:complete
MNPDHSPVNPQAAQVGGFLSDKDGSRAIQGASCECRLEDDGRTAIVVRAHIKDIKRKTRKQYSAEEKIGIVLEGLRGEKASPGACITNGPRIFWRLATSAWPAILPDKPIPAR